jgi:hypothetical protein
MEDKKKYKQVMLSEETINLLLELNQGSPNKAIDYLLNLKPVEVPKIEIDTSKFVTYEELDRKLKAMKLLIDNTYEPLIEQLQKAIRK